MKCLNNNPCMVRIRRVLILCVLLGLGSVAGAVEWVDWGPAPISTGNYSGRVSAVACSPTNPDLYYVAGADGGVWRTTDGGASWTPLTDHMPSSSMGALAIDPTNENIIYVGTGEANYANHSRYGLGLYKSVDGGDTWQVMAADVFSGRCFSKIHIDPNDPQRLYASITRAGGFPELAAAKGHPGAAGSVGVFRSNDGGATWTHLTNGLPNLSATDLSLDQANPNVLYAGIGRIFGSEDNGIYKSNDGGDSWTKLGGGLPTEELGRVSVAVAPSLSTRLYALITHQSNAASGEASLLGAYRSDDSGQTWTQLTDLSSGIQATYGWYLSIIGVHPGDSDLVFVGGVTLWASDDGGFEWSSRTPPHVDMHAIAWDAAGRLLVGDDGGVHRSDDDGQNWEAKNDGLGVIQCYAGLSTVPGVDGRVLVGTQDNGTLRTNEPGYWRQRLGGDGGWTQVDQSNRNWAFAEYQGTGWLFRSKDSGVNFNLSSTGIDPNDRNCFLPPYVIDPIHPKRLLYATHRIYLSTDRGKNWSALGGDLTNGEPAAIRALAMAPSDPNTVYAATNDGRILHSTDSGQNWNPILENVPGWPRITREFFVHPTDPQTVYLAVAYFGETQIRRTHDSGQTWEALDANFPDVPVNVIGVDVRGLRPIIYAGTDTTVYRSLDDGGSWHRYGEGLPTAAVIDLELEPERARLLVATQGRGVWVIDYGLPGDMNGDEVVNALDIDPFILALTDPDGYVAQYPNLDRIVQGDMTGEGVLDEMDIEGFVAALVGD